MTYLTPSILLVDILISPTGNTNPSNSNTLLYTQLTINQRINIKSYIIERSKANDQFYLTVKCIWLLINFKEAINLLFNKLDIKQ